jgi:hypothetical protein
MPSEEVKADSPGTLVGIKDTKEELQLGKDKPVQFVLLTLKAPAALQLKTNPSHLSLTNGRSGFEFV